MSACDDFLFFDAPEDWEQIASIVRQSTVVGDQSNAPIPAFDLGVNIDNQYLAVLIQTTQGKPTWRYGGDLRQVWGSPKGQQTSSNLSEILSDRETLGVNRLQIIKLKKPTSNLFNVRYYPPPWFKDVIVIAWKYTGEVDNFVKDTLFDIGNALGTGTIEPEGILADLQDQIVSLSTTIQALQETQSDEFLIITQAIQDLAQNSNLIEQLNQIDAGLYNLFEALQILIPSDQAATIENSLITRLNLQEEFL